MTTGELLDIERVTSSSERGGWKRAEDQYLAGRLLYCLSGLEGAGRKRTPAKVQRAALPPYAVRYLIHGGDAFSLQKILGHTSLEMTRKYVNLASEDVKEKHRRFSPMDNLGFRVKGRERPKLTKA